MTAAVIYARYSSSNQREESIAGQLRECKRYAESRGFTVIKEYTDAAMTGTTDKRPAFQQMIKDSESHAFQAVIVWKLDRFARNRYDAAVYRHTLTKNGVKLYSAMENISDSPEGIILAGLMEAMAEYYSANLSENIKRGLYDSALEFKPLSAPAFGYKRGDDGKYAIDENTAPIVRRIFEEYAAGTPYMQIIDDLNTDGIRTARNRPFSRNSLRRILRNEKYIGIYQFKDIYAADAIPPIIPKDLFDQVQKELKKRSFTKKKKAPEGAPLYLLTGKLFCGHCGAPMTGESAKSKTGRIYKYYSCTGSKTQGNTGCKKKRAPKDWIETEVLRIINDEILTDEFIDELAGRVVEFQKQARENTTLQILRGNLSEVNKKIGNIIAAIESGIVSNSVQARLDELEARKAELLADIQRESIAPPQFTAQQIKAFLYALKQAQRAGSKTQRYLIDACINRIYLFDSDDPNEMKIVIDVYYGDDKPPASLSSIVRLTAAKLHLCGNRRTLTTETGSIAVCLTIKKRPM